MAIVPAGKGKRIIIAVDGAPPIKQIGGPQRQKRKAARDEAKEKLTVAAKGELKRLGDGAGGYDPPPWDPFEANLTLAIHFRRAKSQADAANIVGGIADALQKILYSNDKQLRQIVYLEEPVEDRDRYTVTVQVFDLKEIQEWLRPENGS